MVVVNLLDISKNVTGPLALYLIELIVKVIRTRHPYRITAIIFHPSNVLELRMRPSVGSRISIEPGQYISLQCPALAKFEWHPFTLTSAPGGLIKRAFSELCIGKIVRQMAGRKNSLVT